MFFLISIYLAFISLGLPDTLLGSSWPFITVAFNIPVGHGGFIAMIIALGTIISSLLTHILVKRLGTGKVTVISVTMTAVALLGFSIAPSFGYLIVFAIPLGLGAGAVDSALNDFVARHYAAKHMNWLHSFWGVGALLGPALVALLTNQGYSWRSGYFSVSIIQFALVALLLSSLSMWKKFEVTENHNEDNPINPQPNGMFSPFKAKGALLALMAFFLYIVVEGTLGLWGASYLVATKKVLPQVAAAGVSFFFLGLTAGRMLSGFASTKFSNETLIRLGALLVIGGLMVLLLPLPNFMIIFFLVVIGLGLAPIFPSLLHQTPIYFEGHDTQAAMGLQMAFAYTASTIMPPILGQLFSRVSFSLLPMTLLLCALIMLICTNRLASIHAN